MLDSEKQGALETELFNVSLRLEKIELTQKLRRMQKQLDSQKTPVSARARPPPTLFKP
jgi:hypothetical protein